MTPEKLSELRGIVAELLRKRFRHVAFDPIDMRPGIDHDGDEIVRVTMVCDDALFGDRGIKLDPRKTLSLDWDIWERFTEAGTKAFPITIYMPRSDWEEESRDATR